MSKTVMSRARGLVSKKKKRFVDKANDIDLDLTYITPRVIAMGFPSVGKEAMFRNPLPAVQKFFEVYHPNDKFKVYNLCAERLYKSDDWFANWAWYPFNDHNPCAFELVYLMCRDIDEFLAADPENVVAIHCKAGKGRTGLMITVYLLHSHFEAMSQEYAVLGLRHPITNATEALEHYGKMRTSNGKGVTIPSQIRWCYYYEEWLRRQAAGIPRELAYKPRTFAIRHLRLVTIPQFDPAMWGGGCDPYMLVNTMVEVPGSHEENISQGHRSTCDVWKTVGIYDQKKANPHISKCHPSLKYGDVPVHGRSFRGSAVPKDAAPSLCVRGNVNIVLTDMDDIGEDDLMCSFWFNTAFVDRPYLVLDKSTIDGANKDKHNKLFSKNFKLELYLEEVPDSWYDPSGLEEHADEDGGGATRLADAAAALGDGDTDDELDGSERDGSERDSAGSAPSSPTSAAERDDDRMDDHNHDDHDSAEVERYSEGELPPSPPEFANRESEEKFQGV
jgi:phosphatidylinositol-3,4,5-trisphosphate 3-phosphatase/dual-specificity protein phosphatase PTEN